MPEKLTSHSFPTPLKPHRCAIIVGASGGIGAAVSRRLAQEGYMLALVDLNEKALKSLCNEINQKSGETRANYYVHNVTGYDSVPETLRGIVAELGGIDLFIYIAGMIHFPALDEYNFPEDHKMVEVNLLGAMAWLGQVAPLFKSMKAGQIVGVSSVAGDRGRIGNPGYNATKAGLTTYLEALRNRLTRHGVNVITIKPGMVTTNMLSLPGAPRPMFAVTPEKAADLIWNAIRKRKQVAYVTGLWYWIMFVVRTIPSFIFRRLNF